MIKSKIAAFWGYAGITGAQMGAIISGCPRFGRWHQTGIDSAYPRGCKTIKTYWVPRSSQIQICISRTINISGHQNHVSSSFKNNFCSSLKCSLAIQFRNPEASFLQGIYDIYIRDFLVNDMPTPIPPTSPPLKRSRFYIFWSKMTRNVLTRMKNQFFNFNDF